MTNTFQIESSAAATFKPQVQGEVRTGESTWFGRTVELQFRDVKSGNYETIVFNRGSLIDFLESHGKKLEKGYIFGLLGGSDAEELQNAFDEVFKGKEIQIKSDITTYSSLITKVDEKLMNTFATTAFGTKIENAESAKERLEELKNTITDSTYEISKSDDSVNDYQIKFSVPIRMTEMFKKALEEKSGGNIKLADDKENTSVKGKKEIVLSMAESGILLGHYLQKLGDSDDHQSLGKLFDSLLLAEEAKLVENEQAKKRLFAGETVKYETTKLETERKEAESIRLAPIRESLTAEGSIKFKETPIKSVSAAEERLNKLVEVTGGGYNVVKSRNEDPRIRFTVPSNMTEILIESLKEKSGNEINIPAMERVKMGDTEQVTLSFDESRIILGHNPENLRDTKRLLLGIQPKF